MKMFKRLFWALLLVSAGLWLIENPGVFTAASFFQLRSSMVQLTGVLAMVCMSVAMILAARPRLPERWVGGLDKMYRLHKWLGVGALVLAVAHWLWAQGPKWAVGWGLLTRPKRGPRPPISNPVEQLLASNRGFAEEIGQWAFYAAVALILVALLKRIPYRFFHQTHRLIVPAYLALAFHSLVLFRFSSWASPVGALVAALLVIGVIAAVITLFRLQARGRQHAGRIASLHYYPELRVLEGRVDVAQGWPGHDPGQFAFVTSRRSEGHHPFTIASDWDAAKPSLMFIAKELGDYTRTLKDELHVGQAVTVEGPYGHFNFDDDRPGQIWIGGGIGITPFIARMKQMARQPANGREIHLFHTTADYSEEALGKLRADAAAAGIRLHILHDPKDGLLTGERIRSEVPSWRDASVWFCGPPSFGEAIKSDFQAQGLDVGERFHQELFAWR